MVPERFWSVMDYVDQRGINVVLADLNGLPEAAHEAINAWIMNIEVVEPPFDASDVKKLKNKRGQDCLGFFEFRIKHNGNQYRPIAAYGPNTKLRQITIFAVAVEQNSRLVPHGICDTCRNRLGKLNNGIGHVVSHDFS